MLDIPVRPTISPEQMVENMRSSLARGLRDVKFCKPHDVTLSVASGGPSLQDTWCKLEAHVAAVNGSLGFLLDKGIVPEFCGVCDANAHMADVVAADPRVRYLIASNCHPSLFDKLLGAGCRVWLWHASPDSLGTQGAGVVLKEARPDTWVQIFGGSTIGLRLINIGYVLGYRRFHLHGLDSSFRGHTTHAYPDRRTGEWAAHSSIEINGYPTSLNFLAQVADFANMITRFSQPDIEPVQFTVHGGGLLQSCYSKWVDANGAMTPQEAFQL